jgi:hypothetical protein
MSVVGALEREGLVRASRNVPDQPCSVARRSQVLSETECDSSNAQTTTPRSVSAITKLLPVRLSGSRQRRCSTTFGSADCSFAKPRSKACLEGLGGLTSSGHPYPAPRPACVLGQLPSRPVAAAVGIDPVLDARPGRASPGGRHSSPKLPRHSSWANGSVGRSFLESALLSG